MLRLGLLLGLIAGALAATVLREPRQDVLLTEDAPEGLVDRVKWQVQQAQQAAKTEKEQKEAEILAEYERARQEAERHDS